MNVEKEVLGLIRKFDNDVNVFEYYNFTWRITRHVKLDKWEKFPLSEQIKEFNLGRALFVSQKFCTSKNYIFAYSNMQTGERKIDTSLDRIKVNRLITEYLKSTNNFINYSKISRILEFSRNKIRRDKFPRKYSELITELDRINTEIDNLVFIFEAASL